MIKKRLIMLLTAVLVFFFGYNTSLFAVSHIADGDLLTAAGSFDIYIVKVIGAKKFKRLILNPEIFKSYGHLKWENVKTVTRGALDEYVLSEFVIEVNADGTVYDPKVYKVSSAPDTDTGERRWLNITASEFESLGYDWDSIYRVNHVEASQDFYPVKPPLTYEILKPTIQQGGVGKEPETKVISFQRPDCSKEVPTSHASIQSAIDLSQSGDKICVLPGTYEENIKIDGKNLVLSGAGATTTIIKAISAGEAVVIKNVSAQTLVEKVTITNGSNFGILIDNASPVIYNNIISNNHAGIRILGNSRPGITYNVFFKNTHGGAIVHNGDVGDWAIDHNTFVDNGNTGGKAALLFDSGFTNTQIKVTNNIFSGGVIGIHETSPTNSVINNNLFYSQSENYARKGSTNYNSISLFNGLTFAKNNIVGDPALDVDYRPRAGSPAIDAADDRKSNIGSR